MTVRSLRNNYMVVASGVRFQSSASGGSKPPKFYQYHVYSACLASELAAKSTDRIMADAHLVPLTPVQTEAVKKAQEIAQELFKAMETVKQVIPLDVDQLDLDVAFSQKLFSSSQGSSNNDFSKGYATAKGEEIARGFVFERPASRDSFSDTDSETILSGVAESVSRTSSGVISAGAETVFTAAEGVSVGSGASGVGEGVKASVSVLGAIGELLGGIFGE